MKPETSHGLAHCRRDYPFQPQANTIFFLRNLKPLPVLEIYVLVTVGNPEVGNPGDNLITNT